MQSDAMDPNWAMEHIQVIRTLMERAAIYRRALAPIMIFAGTLGSLAALVGSLISIDAPRGFIAYWLGVGLITSGGAFGLTRRQALKASEPFWSLPTRRVAQALLPPLIAGFIAGVVVFSHAGTGDPPVSRVLAMLWLPLGWIVLYGCALHSAGFFMPRGIRLFGWLFMLGGCGFFAVGIPDIPPALYAHGLMGSFFGLLHLAYGLYLYFTEPRKNEA